MRKNGFAENNCVKCNGFAGTGVFTDEREIARGAEWFKGDIEPSDMLVTHP